MTLERFQQMIATGKPLAGEEMITFMREQSDATRRLLFDLNGSYHSPEEIVALFSRITDTTRWTIPFAYFLPFIPISGKTSISERMSSSIPVVSFKTKVASLLVTVL